MSESWSSIDWDAERPDWQDILLSHQRLEVETFDLNGPGVTRLLEQLRKTHTNGGAIAKGLQVGRDDILHWFASRNRFGEYDLFRAVLGSPAVRNALPELRIPDPLQNVEFEESWSETLTLDGELAATLVHGGAYEHFEGSATEAKLIGRAFVDAVVGDCHANFKVYRSHRPWAGWFCDIAWDQTWVLIDMSQRQLILLCVTDTD